MRITDALAVTRRVFLDSAPVIYYVERNPSYTALVDPVFDCLDHGTLSAATSPVTLAECLVIPYRLGQTNAARDFSDLIINGKGMSFERLDAVGAKQAAELRARYNLSLTDAFQVAAALGAGCDTFLTNDAALKRVTEIPILVLDDLTA